MAGPKRFADTQFDLFVPYIADMPLRDQMEMMERPFFSLAKRRRQKPIEYVSPDGSVFVNVFPNQEFGMATIWDADVLIWAASTLCEMKRKGLNDVPRTIHFQPYDLLQTICRPTGGRQYMLLREALARLQATTVVTNIRASKGKKHRQFSWIESWTDLIDEASGQSKGMSVTLAEWFYEGVLMEGGVLSIDPLYFSITGGRERWLYRVARKHAGGAGEEGFAISLNTLYEKSGSEGGFRRFKFEMLKIVRENAIPQVDLALEGAEANLLVRMTRADGKGAAQIGKSKASSGAPRPRPRKAAAQEEDQTLDEKTKILIQKDFPELELSSVQKRFDFWIEQDPKRAPQDYNKALYGFARKQSGRREG
ncbi:replication initiator protein A [Neomegalonema perideroedes]|uniref:replication initiator protein A n=1 Tax=Neomegalonema perideroedes TaxID=217219 RepID=UPI00036AA216|nr:replication initiator protein A [Neomegalonema perideroedes]